MCPTVAGLVGGARGGHDALPHLRILLRLVVASIIDESGAHEQDGCGPDGPLFPGGGNPPCVLHLEGELGLSASQL